MKNFRFYIALRFLVAFIFSGIALLSTIGAFHLTTINMERNTNAGQVVLLWAVFIAAIAFVIGYLLTSLQLRPVNTFVHEAERLAPQQPGEAENEETPDAPRDELSRARHVFDRVVTLLDHIKTRELFPEIIGQSKAMRAVLSLIVKVAPSDAGVVILGESGTGKELIAHGLHRHSRRYDKPFAALNCTAIPEGLLESELLGHEKGAFTGASARKIGKFEAADGGTVFLDEIADMPLSTQAKLLRVIEEKTIERVGGSRSIPINVRFIAATNKDLPKLVADGAFREDLYFRLNAFVLELPPLRRRKEDIPLLVEHFLRRSDKQVSASSAAACYLMAYNWPGNVRELKHVVDSAAILADETIEPQHLPSEIVALLGHGEPNRVTPITESGLDARLAEIEKGLIVEALTQTGGIQARAAELLGIKERSLWHRISKYAIDVGALKHHEL